MIQDVPPPAPSAVLPEVVVTAARLPPAAGDAAFAVVRLGAEDLEGAERLDEVLGRVPAVSLFRRTSSLSANPTTQGLSLRAVAPSGAGRALVLLDGVPMNDPFGGWVLWSQLAPEAVSSADVVRGAGAGPYGAGALTGVVALRERDGGGGRLDFSTRDDEGYRLSAAGTLTSGRFSLTTSALSDQSAGYAPVRSAAAGTADTRLDFVARGAAVRLDVAADADTRLSLRAGAYDEDRGSGLAATRSAASGHVLSAVASRSPRPGAPGWRAQVWRRESDFANSSAAVDAGRAFTTPASRQYATPAEGWGGNLAVRGENDVAAGVWEWEAGADARLSTGETQEQFRYMNGVFTRDRKAGGEASVVGAYLESSWRDAVWLVAGGVRLDQWENTDSHRLETDLATGLATLDETYADRRDQVASGRLAVRRSLSGGYALRAAAYTGFRPATLNELHRPFRVGNDLTEANAGLAPERLSGLEAGAAWSGRLAGGRTDAVLTLFRNRVEDVIVNVTLGEGPGIIPALPQAGFVPAGGVLRQRQNAGRIEATGVEASVSWTTDRLDLRLAASATDAEVDGGAAAPQLTGLRPAQAPVWSVTGGLDWRASRRASIALDVRYESRRFDDDLNSRVLDAAAVVDARIDWRVSRGVVAYAGVANLLDAEVEVSATATGVKGWAAPATALIGLRLDW
ncbi:TonB-dependent receptor [Brevundimonas sp. VNH65]|uniref:TonB-dependent receptor n=1 Tax=Brevundimonas sp. VNH65 TaxID=3400917 RepID=UPI003BFE1155